MVKCGKTKTRKTSNKFTILVAQVVKELFVMINDDKTYIDLMCKKF